MMTNQTVTRWCAFGPTLTEWYKVDPELNILCKGNPDFHVCCEADSDLTDQLLLAFAGDSASDARKTGSPHR